MKSWIYFTRMWLTISLQSRDYLSPVMWLYPHFPVHNSPLNHTSYPHILQLQPTSSCDRISSVTWLFLFSHVTILPYETITHVTTSISHMITAPPFQAMLVYVLVLWLYPPTHQHRVDVEAAVDWREVDEVLGAHFRVWLVAAVQQFLHILR